MVTPEPASVPLILRSAVAPRRSFWALRVPAPEEPGLVARGASPWNANDRAGKPQWGGRAPEVGARRGWPGTAAWVWCIGRRCPSHACRSLSPLRGFVVRGCRCPGACAPGYRPSSLLDECAIPHNAAGVPLLLSSAESDCRPFWDTAQEQWHTTNNPQHKL